MKVKTSELSGAALDWAAGKARGLSDDEIYGWDPIKGVKELIPWASNWALAGPLIERERIYVYPHPDGSTWLAVLKGAAFNEESATPLIAAMRCYVASKLGAEVEVPVALLGDPA